MLRYFIVPLLAAYAGLLGPAARADVVFPPGTRIGLDPPPGLTVSKQHAGFDDLERKVAITILDVPFGAYEKIEKDLFDSASQKGLTMEKRESFPFASGIGFLAVARADIGGVAMHRWFFLAKAISGPSGPLTAFITVDVPDTAQEAYPDAAIRKALATVTFRAPPIAEQLSLLPFKINDLNGFEVAKVLPGGTILTEGTPGDLNRQSYVLISIGRGGPEQAGDRAAFARDLIQSAPVNELRITSGDAMRIGGSPGFEIRAQAKSPSGEPILLVQWLRFGGAAYMRIIGVARKDDWDNLFPRFRALRDSIEAR